MGQVFSIIFKENYFESLKENNNERFDDKK